MRFEGFFLIKIENPNKKERVENVGGREERGEENCGGFFVFIDSLFLLETLR